MLHIAWIDTEPDDGDTAQVTIWETVLCRFDEFSADTALPAAAGPEAIVDAATKLLQDGGYTVHSVEPNNLGCGYAAIVESHGE